MNLFEFSHSHCSQDDLDKKNSRYDIPALAGASTSAQTKRSKEYTIQAIEAQLKALESKQEDFVVNRTTVNEVPLVRRYQFNKNVEGTGQHNTSKFGITRNKYSSGPYDRRRHPRR